MPGQLFASLPPAEFGVQCCFDRRHFLSSLLLSGETFSVTTAAAAATENCLQRPTRHFWPFVFPRACVGLVVASNEHVIQRGLFAISLLIRANQETNVFLGASPCPMVTSGKCGFLIPASNERRESIWARQSLLKSPSADERNGLTRAT